MPDTIRCPDCGAENPAGSEHCRNCNFPLQAAGASTERPPEPEIVIRRPARRPMRRPRSPGTSPLFLWSFLGLVAAAALIYTAWTSFRKNNAVPIEGASEVQQREADSLRTVLARDSTNVEANIALGNVLYDTANWHEAARAYARGVAGDSTRVGAIVDMGTCWLNIGDAQQAARLYELALERQPGYPNALFNLGYVYDRAGETAKALGYYQQALASTPPGTEERAKVLASMGSLYERANDFAAALRSYHQALDSNPPEELKQQIVVHMQEILQKTGQKVPPLPPGSAPAQGAPGMPPGGSGSQP